MKVKNLMFSGFMAAILTGIACSADAAVVASKEYVDARETSILGTVEQTYQKSNTALTRKNVQDEIEAVVGTAENGLIKDVADNKSAISDLSDDVSANTAAIRTLNGDENTTGSVQNQIKVLSDLLGGTSGDVSTLTTQVATNKSAIEKLNGDGEGSIANKISTALTNYDTSDEVAAAISDASDALTIEINKKQDTITGNQLSALNSNITAEKVATFEGYATSKQDTITGNQLSALNSNITAEKVATFEGYATSKQDTITGNQLSALNSNITAEKVATFEGYATSKQDVMSAGNDYVTVANNKVSVNVDGTVAANNAGLVTGGTVYTYALPKPTACEETTCVLSVNRNGQPYWMKLELASGGSSDPETTND